MKAAVKEKNTEHQLIFSMTGCLGCTVTLLKRITTLSNIYVHVHSV